MKFLYSDALDFVDPEYDFIEDRSVPGRRAHKDDEYPHEYLETAPYDGLLVSRGIVGGTRGGGKYSEAQALRLGREGARAFLRYPESRFPGTMIVGDNGAFTYRNDAVPPYTVEDTIDFYEDGRFTHGCSVDHLIFDFDEAEGPPSDVAKQRYDLTLQLADEFRRAAVWLGPSFTPLGVVQGWSPRSMAEAARSLVKMGYDYLAIGGMVPLRIDQIDRALTAIRTAVPDSTRLHVLGFGKVDDLDRLAAHNVTSFDTTSPLLRAFKDAKRNYYSVGPGGETAYHMAIRIPQAIENNRVKRASRKGTVDQDALQRLESAALEEVRNFAAHKTSVETAVDTVLAYSRFALREDGHDDTQNERRLAKLREAYLATLRDRPWEECRCRVCQDIGVEVVIFRSSNRNKRRGMHNLHVFYEQLNVSAAAGKIAA
nr:tRNA-guanine transglycosylase DpdA [Sphingomonas kyeonggiensis]